MMEYAISHYGGIILAAGGSTRMGTPKQLLDYHGKNFLEHAVAAVKGLGDLPVCIVLGAEADRIREKSCLEGCFTVVNEQWQEGMSGSIKRGVIALQSSFPEVDGIMVIVCDQPHLSTAGLKALMESQKATGKPIAACRYSGVMGTPALFHVSTFPSLLALEGDKGARKLLEKSKNDVVAVEFEKGRIDIDTTADYEQLMKGQEEHDH